MKMWKKIVLFLVVTCLIIQGGIITGLYFFQEKMIFPATSLPKEHQFTFDIPFEELNIDVNGAQLNALHFKQPDPKGVVFFLHGNAGNLQTWTSGVDFFQKENYDLFIFDYRGYGKSTGKITSEAQLHSDVKTAWHYIRQQYANKNKVIYGRSLGTSLAAKLAKHEDADLLILVSPFTSMKNIAKQRFPLIPSMILRYPLETDAIIADITTPTLFITGSEDSLTPPKQAQELLSLMRNEARLLLIEGAGHGDIHQFDTYYTGLAQALSN